MRKEEIIPMAREAGFMTGTLDYADGKGTRPLVQLLTQECLIPVENLAKAAYAAGAAAEREKYKWDVHSCGPTCTNAVCVAVREAVEAELEACADLCDQLANDSRELRFAAAIRARRNT